MTVEHSHGRVDVRADSRQFWLQIRPGWCVWGLAYLVLGLLWAGAFTRIFYTDWSWDWMLIPRVALVLSGLLLALHGLYTNVGRFTLQWQDSAGSAQWQFWGLRRRQFFEPSALSKLTCVPIYHDIYAISIAVRGGGDLRFGAQLSSASRAWLMDQLEKAIAAHRAGSQS